MDSSQVHPALRAQLDQGLSEALDGLVSKAAEHDGKDLIEANTDFTNWLNASPLTRAQLAAATASLALRLRRLQAGLE